MANDFTSNLWGMIRKMKQQVEVFTQQQRFKRERHNKQIKGKLYLNYCEMK